MDEKFVVRALWVTSRYTGGKCNSILLISELAQHFLKVHGVKGSSPEVRRLVKTVEMAMIDGTAMCMNTSQCSLNDFHLYELVLVLSR